MHLKEVTDLPVSHDLKTAFLQWDGRYQATLDHSYPPDSCLASEQLAQDHNAEGVVLSKRLQAELGAGYDVDEPLCAQIGLLWLTGQNGFSLSVYDT